MTSTLYVFYANGCPACDAAKPEVEKFKTKHPLQMVLTLDADGPYAERFGIAPIRVTPLYLLKVGDRGVKHEGTMNAAALDKWITRAAEELT